MDTSSDNVQSDLEVTTQEQFAMDRMQCVQTLSFCLIEYVLLPLYVLCFCYF